MNEENILIEHDQSIDPRIARILTITGLVLACCCIMPPGLLWGCANRDAPRGKSMMTGTVCFVLSTLLFMFYASDLEELDKQEYQGLMRVVGWNVIRYTITEANPNSDEPPLSNSYFGAEVTVDWGYKWGCPNHNDVVCSNSTVMMCIKHACKDSRCKDENDRRAEAAALECAQTTIYDYNKTYTPFDPSVGPSNDVDWPSVVLFGDCDTCTVDRHVPDANNVQTLKKWGFISLGISIVCFITAFIMIITKWEERTNDSSKTTCCSKLSNMKMSLPFSVPESPGEKLRRNNEMRNIEVVNTSPTIKEQQVASPSHTIINDKIGNDGGQANIEAEVETPNQKG